ncbi:R3H domain-containing nucleic acid-binding protein [Anaerolinea thermophila]|uniref:R3H domain-containing nucleic acid-binding protein n=1 Tax=Anaerolinea thermophila TaxID=167964 RepID=UPI0026ED7D2B|nr:R3H domain-containing nucleic acid-binding protein [Anaerolinea thermophila]
MTQRRITDDLHVLMGVLPPRIAEAVQKANNSDQLLEIVMDLGRKPVARFTNGDLTLLEEEVTHDDLDFTVSRIGEFDADNRAGLERTLHRISAIRNRRGHIVGLTCRVGRAVYSTIDIIQDLIESGKSVLILGRPGIGKTTMLREAARILAEKKRVVIVDTSNEIGGDGDVPHPAVGAARRMQVPKPSLQHEVMIEAVENHNPEVIVIDEIGRELEAAAARTIAERGVQLIGTAHGRTLENLLLNPTLSDLVGGIEAVTLSDEEARRRGTQKTVLERRAPPTFDVLIEIQERDRLAIHPDVAAAVDALVRNNPLPPEIRYRDAEGNIHVEKPPAQPAARNGYGAMQAGFRRLMNEPTGARSTEMTPGRREEPESEPRSMRGERLQPIRIYPYGVARNRLQQSAKRLGVPALIVRALEEADVLITLRAYYRSRQQTILEAEQRGMPIYVLRANTNTQIEQLLAELFNLSMQPEDGDEWEETMAQTQAAIQMVMNGERYVDLAPASAAIRRMQHEMARQYQLTSHSYGKEPNRRVRIYRE